MRRLLSVANITVALLGATLVATSMAQADAPVTTTTTFDRTFTFPCPQGFDLISRYTGSETIRRFDGTQQTEERLVSSFTNSISGETLTSVTPWVITFRPDTVSFVGVTFRLNEPGVGLVAIDAGRVVYDRQTGEVILEDGPADTRPNLCTALQ
jgi:hypothetical protein